MTLRDLITTLVMHQSLSDKIRIFIEKANLKGLFFQIHQDFLVELLKSADIFEPDANIRLENRKLVCFVLWKCIDFCKRIINEGLWSISIGAIWQELKDSNNTENQILLFSILKFIGQYTSDILIYRMCAKIVDISQELVLPGCISMKDLAHLISFNPNMKNKTEILPKTTELNRMKSFEFPIQRFDPETKKECTMIYQDIRYNYGHQLIVKDDSVINCLYYLDAFYHVECDEEDILELDTKLDDRVDEIYSNLNNYNFPENHSVMFDEFNIEVNVEDMLENRLNLIGSVQNFDEIKYVMDDAMAVTDTYLPKKHFYETYRYFLFTSLYEKSFLSVGDIRTRIIYMSATRQKRQWIIDFIDNLRKAHLKTNLINFI